jgi:hypothetical protein
MDRTKSAKLYALHFLEGNGKYLLAGALGVAVYAGGFIYGRHTVMEDVRRGTLEWLEPNEGERRDLGLYIDGKPITGFQQVGDRFMGVEKLYEEQRQRLELRKQELQRSLEDRLR